MYKGNGLKASLGYEVLSSQAVASPRTPLQISQQVNQETFQAGASYTMNNFSFGLQYQDTTDFGFLVDADYMAYAATGKATFGNNAISLIYTHSELDPKGSNNDLDTDGWGVAAEHNFSKRTKVYAAYAHNSADADQSSDDIDSDTFSLGMIHNF
jgi:predicted porin